MVFRLMLIIYTGYLSAAKRLGISKGVGGNRFAPDEEISRQDMLTLLYRALEVLGDLPEPNGAAKLSDFTDASLIFDYAKEACEAMVEAGAFPEDSCEFAPQMLSTRALMVQVLYRLLGH